MRNLTRRATAPAIAVLAAAALGLIGAGRASAASFSDNCTVSGTTATCTFSPGSEGTLAVPADVSSMHVVAVAAGGGTVVPGGGQGGPGAQVTADLSVTPGSTLFAEVAIGGGPQGGDGAGGGGESDLRTCSINDPTCPAVGTAQDPRLIVAGGGGGAGAFGDGGNGGGGGVGTSTCNPGGNGGNGRDGSSIGDGGTGGGCSSGGAGGAGAPDNGGTGQTGTASSGGAGGSSPGNYGGGGGGAGYFGGGGGGSNGNGPGNGGGGGGGSSFGPAGSVFATATTGPSVTISFTVTASDLAGFLVSDSTGIAPGTALADKATAIQTAVNANPPQTATACAGITDYLGLVQAQTGKKLTQAQAQELTADANNLAAFLGC